jgi:hypothetical protein
VLSQLTGPTLSRLFADSYSGFLALILDWIGGTISCELILELERFFLHGDEFGEKLTTFGLQSVSIQRRGGHERRQ